MHICPWRTDAHTLFAIKSSGINKVDIADMLRERQQVDGGTGTELHRTTSPLHLRVLWTRYTRDFRWILLKMCLCSGRRGGTGGSSGYNARIIVNVSNIPNGHKSILRSYCNFIGGVIPAARKTGVIGCWKNVSIRRYWIDMKTKRTTYLSG